MNKDIVVEEISKTLLEYSRFANIGRVLDMAEDIYNKLEVIGALKQKEKASQVNTASARGHAQG